MAARRKVGKGKKRTQRAAAKKKRPAPRARAVEPRIDPALVDAIAQSHAQISSDPLTSEKSDPDLELLTKRRRRFIEEYMICGNQTKAAELAGFSPNRADVEGSELLKDPIISGIIARREANIYKRLGVTQERILEERVGIALADLGEVFTERADGTPEMRPLSDWPPAIRKAIKTIKVKRHDAKLTETSYEPGYDIVEIGLWEKPAQLEKIEERLESDRKRGDTAESLTEKQRIRKIAEILSRGRKALEASKKKKAS